MATSRRNSRHFHGIASQSGGGYVVGCLHFAGINVIFLLDMDLEKHKKKVRDADRYRLRVGIDVLPDICYFCGGNGCDANHHEHYGEPAKKHRCHGKCHTIYHNKKRAEKKKCDVQ